MASWAEFDTAEPEFAARARSLLEAGRHRTMATIRADGSPRISGIECEIVDGHLTWGSMAGARKGADLGRDPRFALHGATFHPEAGRESEWQGEAKVAGVAILSPGPEDGDQQFVADIREVVVTGLNEDATGLVVEWWTPGGGRRRVERD